MKKFWKSKTFWVNLIALVAVVATGKELDAAIVGPILAVINMGLRLVTKEPIQW